MKCPNKCAIKGRPAIMLKYMQIGCDGKTTLECPVCRCYRRVKYRGWEKYVHNREQ
jgi:hypothetical protein